MARRIMGHVMDSPRRPNESSVDKMSIARVAGVSFFLLLLGGCPQLLPVTGTSAVNAQISYSTATGDAPLTVSLSAAASSSRNGGTLTYAWDFDDGGGSNEKIVNHVFTNPGRYVLRLIVTDGEGESDMATLEIRVQGTGAVAVIETDVSSGSRPLTVQFDGTGSVITDDIVRDLPLELRRWHGLVPSRAHATRTTLRARTR